MVSGCRSSKGSKRRNPEADRWLEGARRWKEKGARLQTHRWNMTGRSYTQHGMLSTFEATEEEVKISSQSSNVIAGRLKREADEFLSHKFEGQRGQA